MLLIFIIVGFSLIIYWLSNIDINCLSLCTAQRSSLQLSFTSTTLHCRWHNFSTTYQLQCKSGKSRSFTTIKSWIKAPMAARWIRRRLSGEPDSEAENHKKCRHGRIHNRSETSLRRRVMDRRSSEKVDPDSHSTEIKTIEVTVCSDAHRPESTVISKARSTVIGIITSWNIFIHFLII